MVATGNDCRALRGNRATPREDLWTTILSRSPTSITTASTIWCFAEFGWDNLSARKPDAIPRGTLKGVVNINGVDRVSVEKLYAIRGTLPEMWRRLSNWRPAEDFDDDGIPDMVLDDCTKAISGRDGHLLWQSSEPYGEHMVLPPAHNDLDGDGTPDFLAIGQGLEPEWRSPVGRDSLPN